MSPIRNRPNTFHPVTVLFAAIVAAAIFALFVYLIFEGEMRQFLLVYFVPIGVPFVCFLFDRAERRASISRAEWLIDVAVLIPALIRAFVLIPIISGHALFLSYALLTSRSGVARVTAVLILLQVAYIKIFVWQDATLFGGVLVGCVAAVFYRQTAVARCKSPAAL